MNEDHDKPFKVIVFGDAGVGKSASKPCTLTPKDIYVSISLQVNINLLLLKFPKTLSIRYVSKEFSTTYDPTIEDNYETDIEVDGFPLKVELIDTAGNDVFRRMRDQYIKSGDGFLLVYSITDHLSSHSITTFHEQIIAARGEKDKIIPQIPIILVGNKCDLEDDREVSYLDGKKIAATFSCPFFETSAKNDISVDEVFINLARQMKEARADSVRKAFIRERRRFSLRNMSLRERKCKEKLQALRPNETASSVPKRRRRSVLRGFICGAGNLSATDI